MNEAQLTNNERLGCVLDSTLLKLTGQTGNVAHSLSATAELVVEASWTICWTRVNTAVAVLNCNHWCIESQWSTLQWLYCHTYCMVCCDRYQSTRRNMYQASVTVRTSSPSSASTTPVQDSGAAGNSVPLKPIYWHTANTASLLTVPSNVNQSLLKIPAFHVQMLAGSCGEEHVVCDAGSSSSSCSAYLSVFLFISRKLSCYIISDGVSRTVIISFAADLETSTDSVSNTPTSSTELNTDSPSRSRSLATTPAVRFLTRPDLFTLIQNNEVRSLLFCL